MWFSSACSAAERSSSGWSGKRDFHLETLHQVYEFLIEEVSRVGNIFRQ